MKSKWWIIGAAIAVAALTIGTFSWLGQEDTAWAAEEQQTGRRLTDHFVRGTVTEVEDEKVVVETKEGKSALLFLSDTTRFWTPGEPPTATRELALGDPVLALGRKAVSDDGGQALEALLVVIASDEDLPRILIRGRVEAVTRQTIVVQTGRGERAVAVLPRTRLRSIEGQVDSLHDVQPGQQIIALGQPTEMGQWIAGLVLLPNPQATARNGLRGEVMDIDLDAGTLTVQTDQRGEISVLVNDGTRYRIPGVEAPGLSDIQVGDRIVAVGHFDGDSRTQFLARGIGVLTTPAEQRQP
jgi:RNase P/RNase MRP subunit p29